MKRNRIISVLLIILMIFGLTPISVFANGSPPAPTLTLVEDTGVAGDRITSNGTITIGNLADGATWEYSINGGISWNAGTGASFVLSDGTYAIGTVQARQIGGGLTSVSANNAEVWVIAGNQVVNGDFQQGNTGFSTGYTYHGITRPPDMDANRYTVIKQAIDVHSAFTSKYDKTNGDATGLYFAANGAADLTIVVWQSNAIEVKAGMEYRFEAYVSTLYQIGEGGASAPRLRFELGDGAKWAQMGETYVFPASVQGDDVGKWHLSYADGKFTNGGTYYVRLMNLQTVAFGNDFGVDDIYFGLRGASPSASDPDTNPTVDPGTFNTSTFFSMELAEDTGISNSDQITANGQVNLSNVQTIWEYSTNNGVDWTGGNGNNFTLAGDGSKSVIVRQKAVIGDQWSSNSAPFEFELDTTAPLIETAVVNDTIITLDYNEILDSNNIPSVSDFSVAVDGGAPIEPASLNVSSDKITLTLPSRVVNGQTVTINYIVPGSNNAIRDIAGNKAVALNNQAVINNTITVTYHDNNATSGTVPNSQNKTSGVDLTLATNSGSLAKDGYTLIGWNTQSEGSGTDYAEGGNYDQDQSITLYAKWNINEVIDIVAIPGVTVPVRGATPVTTITETAQYTGTVSWAPDHNPFGASTVYTATITLTPKTGYTLTGVAEDFFTVAGTSTPATNAANDGVVTAVFPATAATFSGDSSGEDSTPTTPPPTEESVIVIVNGQEHNAGIKTKTTEDGKSTVTVEVDNKIIESKIEEAIKNNPTGINNLIQVPVADTQSDVVKVELTGDIVKKLEDNSFDVSVKRDNIEYIIPAEEFTISKVAENLGISEKDLHEIKVEVKIAKLDEKVVERYNEVAKANGAELVFLPVEFQIVAKTTKADGTRADVEISKFSNYVERIMKIPAEVDRSKITTGIVFNPDGTYSHVPTEVFQKDGKWYAKLNSLTNSNYSVVWNPVTVKSVENHWSKDAVNDMASRLVIFNPESFDPNKAITRADFAEYIVRALGLYRESSTHENKFKDVSETSDRTLGILIANEYGIVSGYPDSTFRPEQQITREEAMAMCQKAMTVTKLVGVDPIRYQSYTDYNQVGSWATTSVKEVLSAQVFNGTTATTISPKLSLTYAEAAQAIKNLLVKSKLINK